MRKIYKIGLGIIGVPIFLLGVLVSVFLIWLAFENTGFSKSKLNALTTPDHYITGISNSELEDILCQLEYWIDREEKALDEIIEQPSKAKQQSMAIDYLNNFDNNESEVIKDAIKMLNCTDFQDKLTKSQQERKKVLYAKIARHEQRLSIIKGLFK